MNFLNDGWYGQNVALYSFYSTPGKNDPQNLTRTAVWH